MGITESTQRSRESFEATDENGYKNVKCRNMEVATKYNETTFTSQAILKVPVLTFVDTEYVEDDDGNDTEEVAQNAYNYWSHREYPLDLSNARILAVQLLEAVGDSKSAEALRKAYSGRNY